MKRWVAAMGAVLAFACPAWAAQGQPVEGRVLPDSASPFGPVSVSDADRAGVAMPELAGTPTPEDVENFDKYYVFHRDGADFATAYADISECDGYASGLQSGIGTQTVYSPTMAGAIGGAVGNVLAQAIFGSAEKRRMRRVNMRTCMNFKGYGRYGLPKSLWTKFNFEEGFSGVGDEERQRLLRQQALVASSARPAGTELGL